MKKTLLFKSILIQSCLVLGALLTSISAEAQLDTVQIGSATTSTTSTGQSPFGTFYHDNKNQILFTAAELNAAGFSGGLMFGIALEVSSAQPQVMENFEVQVKQTSATVMNAFETGFVIHHTSNHTASTGWNYLDFSSPFIWDGSSNILIQTCFNNSSYTSNSGVYYTTTSSNTNAYGYSDSSVPDPCSGEPYDGSSTQRPNVRFIVTPPAPVDAGIVSIDSPSIPACNLGNNVWATLGNFGTDTLTSATINWSINGTAQTPMAWTGSLPFGQTVSVQVGSGSIVDGDTVVVWSYMPNGVADTTNYNDTVTLNVVSGLSGVKFITPTGVGDYTSFTDAVADLAAYGVCGPVTFIVSQDVYTERVEIPEILNASEVNTIRFTGLNGATSSVELTYTSTGTADNGTLFLNGADHFIFDHMTISNGSTGTYSSAINFTNGSSHNTFDSLNIVGNQATSTTSYYAAAVLSYGGIDTSNVISNNNISGGSYGVYLRGGGTTSLEKGNTVHSNNITDWYFYGVYGYYTEDLTISHNLVLPHQTSSYVYTRGFYFYYSNGNLRFHHNKYVGSKYGYGAYFGSCSAPASSPGYIYNNSFSVGDAATTSTSYGLYLSSCNHQVVHSNSVHMNSNSTNSRALYITSGGNNRLYSNNFVNMGPGYAMYYNSGYSESDNNNGYAPNGNFGYAAGAQASLANFQSATATDMNSVSVDPGFPSFDILTTCNDTLDMGGVADSMVVDDIDGNIRSTTPDIGAYEFDGVNSFTIGADTMICSTSSITLGNAASNSNWLWNTGLMTNTISANAPGSYVAQITNACGTGLDTMVLGHLPDVEADFDQNTSYLTGLFTSTSTAADTYLWDFGDGSTDTVENPIHIYSTTGWYEVTLTVTGVCGTSTFMDSVYIFIQNIDEVEALSFGMYPNPADDNITITASSVLSKANIEVMDATGRIVLTTNASGNRFNLNLNTLEAGPYFIRITDEGKTSTQRLIVR